MYNRFTKLSAWSGLKCGNFLFHIMHWTDIISNDAPSALLVWKTPLPVALVRKKNTAMLIQTWICCYNVPWMVCIIKKPMAFTLDGLAKQQ